MSNNLPDPVRELREKYPSIVILSDGKVALQSRDNTHMIVLENEEIVNYVTTETERNQLERYKPGGRSDLIELARKEGLEKEYCLVFMNKIFFHSPAKTDCDAYARENSNVGFTLYTPDVTKGGLL